MRILAIMAGGMDGPVESGCIGEVVAERGATLHWCYRRLGQPLPETTTGHEALIVFGGEPSVYDPALRDYFEALAALIRLFHDEGKPVLGSCLGCQAIAFAFGARVYPAGLLEYGFTPLTLSAQAQADPLLHGIAPVQTLFEMHADTFDLPVGAVPLLEGETVRNQGFRLADSTWGFQCHFEVTPSIVNTWTTRELIGNPAHDQPQVQQRLRLVHEDFGRYQEAQNRFARALVGRWMDRVEAHGVSIHRTPQVQARTRLLSGS